MSRSAVFLDRDGTLIREEHYLGLPGRVAILPGVAQAIRRLNEAGLAVIVVTNQSGIARGYFTVADFERVQQRMEELLAADGARLDGVYMCPHHPHFTGQCDCRKPAPRLFRDAAAAHDIDLVRSWYLGDKLRDVLPAGELGGRGILIPNAETPASEIEQARAEFDIAASLDEAVGRIVESAQ